MGRLQVIASANANSGSTSSAFSFQNIPNTYTDLALYISLRTTQASTATDGIIYMNGITSGYDYYSLRSAGITLSSGSSQNAANGWFAIPGSSATSSIFSNTFIYLPNYSFTTSNKTWLSESMNVNGGTNPVVDYEATTRNSTTTISRIDIFVFSSNSIAQYSTAYLYGVERTP